MKKLFAKQVGEQKKDNPGEFVSVLKVRIISEDDAQL